MEGDEAETDEKPIRKNTRIRVETKQIRNRSETEQKQFRDRLETRRIRLDPNKVGKGIKN